VILQLVIATQMVSRRSSELVEGNPAAAQQRRGSSHGNPLVENQGILRRLRQSVQQHARRVEVPRVREVSQRSLLLTLEHTRTSHRSPWINIAAPRVAHHMRDMYKSYPPARKVSAWASLPRWVV
jgi:hypothetical protein